MIVAFLPLELTHPLFLLGLLVLQVLAWCFYRGLTDFARWQRILSFARVVIDSNHDDEGEIGNSWRKFRLGLRSC